MTDITLDKRITKVGDAAKEAFSELHKIQQKERLLLKTGEEMIDGHIGSLLAGDVVIIAGAPSAGKSEFLYRTIEKIMSKEVKPNAGNFVSLVYSMEMKML